MKKLLFFIMLLFALGLLLGGCSNIANPDPFIAKHGEIDLSNYDIKHNGIIRLAGEWEFFFGRLLYERDFTANHIRPKFIQVPAYWNYCEIDGKNIPGVGYATYRLKIKGVQKSEKLAVYVKEIASAYRIFINNALIAQSGIVGMDEETSKPEFKAASYNFEAPGSSFDVIVQVANYANTRGGMQTAIQLGSQEQIAKSIDHTVKRELFFISSMFIIGLYHFVMYFLRPGEKTNLYFFLSCFLLVARKLIEGSGLFFIIDHLSYEWSVFIIYFTVLWGAVLVVAFIGSIFPQETNKKLLKVAWMIALGYTAFIVAVPVKLYSSAISRTFINSYTMIVCLYAVYIAAKAAVHRRKNSLLLLFGYIQLVMSVAHDLLFNLTIINHNFGEINLYMAFVMVLIQAFIIARNYKDAYINAERLSVQLEAALRKEKSYSDRLSEIDRLKDDFLANTSHEFKTPLNAIIGISESMIRKYDGAINDAQREQLSIITTSSRRLSNLVNDILDYSRIRNHDIKLNITPVCVKVVAESVVRAFGYVRPNNSVELILDIPENSLAVMADESRLIQIFYNLIGNAGKFTENGYIKVWAKPDGGNCLICVEDTGSGIARNKVEDVFKSFEQIDSSLTRKHGGTGLGLSITRYLIELMGGRIWVESEEGWGSCFYFLLPKAEEIKTDQILSEKTIFLAEEPKTLSFEVIQDGAHVLVVDDDAASLQALIAILKNDGYSVTGVTDGNAAIKLAAKDDKYALVILDVMLPKISGYEVCKKIRETKEPFDLPILMLSAKNAVKDFVVGFEAGANDYVIKPFEIDELLARVRTLVGLKMTVDKALTAENAFLQAQIKPHFLYNVLSTIAEYCVIDAKRAGDLIIHLAQYLRRSFDFSNLEKTISLQKELDMTKAYLAIEQARFDEIVVEYDIDADHSMQVPPLIIQPLVENAVKHGLKSVGYQGMIILSIKKDSTGVEISISDTGQGMDSAFIEKILETTSADGGIGLYNIHTRLKRRFGQGLQIHSGQGAGTTVKIMIPSG